MGVLNCSRHSCENIMCDRYSHIYGYICNSCFEELVALGASIDIDEFMNTSPDQSNTLADYNYFDTIFPLPEN